MPPARPPLAESTSGRSILAAAKDLARAALGRHAASAPRVAVTLVVYSPRGLAAAQVWVSFPSPIAGAAARDAPRLA